MSSGNQSSVAIQALVDTFGILSSDVHAAAFRLRTESVNVTEFAKTWIGVNFMDTDFVSLKLYFTAYEPLSREALAYVFRNSLIAEDCLQLMTQLEPCLDPEVMGSGYTVCLKLGPTGSSAFGFYVRTRNGGLFRHYTDLGWFDKNYHYVSGSEQLDSFAIKLGMPFLRDCKSLEIGSGRSHGLSDTNDSLKVVLEGSFSDLSPKLYTETEQNVISALEKRFGLVATCGGVYCSPSLKSVYFSTPFVSPDRIRTFTALVD